MYVKQLRFNLATHHTSTLKYFHFSTFLCYKCTENTSLIRELDLNIVLWKQTAFNRACFKSQQRSLLRRLYQRICIQAPVVQEIGHRVYFMFLSREKSLWAWVRILKSGLDKVFFFFSLFFYICIYCISLTITTIFKRIINTRLQLRI